jgi:hypothetical protein
MTDLVLLLIAVFVFMILFRVMEIDKRLNERFPTEREADYKWSQDDPIGQRRGDPQPGSVLRKGEIVPLGWPRLNPIIAHEAATPRDTASGNH